MEEHFDQWSCDEIMEVEIETSRDESSADAGRTFVYNSIPGYSEEEAQALAKRLENEETFNEAMKVLNAWLERGECNERNSTCFYSLIRLCWNRFEKLQAVERGYLEEIKRLQNSALSRSCCIQLSLIEIEEIFRTIEKQNLWICFTRDHFEKIQEMRADLLNLKRIILEGSVLEKESDDMIIEDEQAGSSVQKMQSKHDSLTSNLDVVYEKTEEMQVNYEEYKNETLRLKTEKGKIKAYENKEYLFVFREKKTNFLVEVAPQSDVDQNDMHLVSLISIYLFECPNKIDLDSIYNHLKECIPDTDASFTVTDIENLLRKYPNIFKETCFSYPYVVRKWSCLSVTPENRTIIVERGLHIQKLPKKLPKKKQPLKCVYRKWPYRKYPSTKLSYEDWARKKLPYKKVPIKKRINIKRRSMKRLNKKRLIIKRLNRKRLNKQRLDKQRQIKKVCLEIDINI